MKYKFADISVLRKFWWQILNIRNISLLLIEIDDTYGTQEETRTRYCPSRDGRPALLLWKSQSPNRPLEQGCHRGLVLISQEPQHHRRQTLSE